MEKKYDEICGVTYINLYTKTKNAQDIVISPFDPKNKEHLYVLGVAKGLSGAVQKTIKLDTTKYNLWKLNRKVAKECRCERLIGEKPYHYVDPDELLNFMRDWAGQLCQCEEGINFDFGVIYDAFYNVKQKRKKGKER